MKDKIQMILIALIITVGLFGISDILVEEFIFKNLEENMEAVLENNKHLGGDELLIEVDETNIQTVEVPLEVETAFIHLEDVLTDDEEIEEIIDEEVKEIVAFTPIYVEQTNIDGIEYYTKIFEVPIDTPQSEVEEKEFIEKPFLFTHLTTTKSIKETNDTKHMIEEVFVESEGNNVDDVVKQLSSTREYNTDGYVGVLTLDVGSITTSVKGYSSKENNVSAVREYTNLDYADPSLIPQSIQEDGRTLPVTNINWVVTGTGLSGDSLVPIRHTAIATYGTTYSTQVIDGYMSNAKYMGEVSKTEGESMIYTLQYSGKVMEEYITQSTVSPMNFYFGDEINNNDEELEIEEILVEKNNSLVTIIFTTLLTILVTALVFSYKIYRAYKVEVFNWNGRKFISIGSQVMNKQRPMIDLNEFDGLIKSNEFAFALDKYTTKRLYKRTIGVTYQNTIVKHRIVGFYEEYKFKIDLNEFQGEMRGHTL